MRLCKPRKVSYALDDTENEVYNFWVLLFSYVGLAIPIRCRFVGNLNIWVLFANKIV
jgi:hypothetical protein